VCNLGADMPATETSHQGDDDCSKSSVCPARCTCTDTIVDCRDRGLTEIPTNIPQTITELLSFLLLFSFTISYRCPKYLVCEFHCFRVILNSRVVTQETRSPKFTISICCGLVGQVVDLQVIVQIHDILKQVDFRL